MIFVLFLVQSEKTYFNCKHYKQHDIFISLNPALIISDCEPHPQLGVKSGSKTTFIAGKNILLFFEL